MVISCAYFGIKLFLQTNYFCQASSIAAEETIFNVFSYNAASNRDSNLLHPRRRTGALRVEPQSRVELVIVYVKIFNVSFKSLNSSLQILLGQIHPVGDSYRRTTPEKQNI